MGNMKIIRFIKAQIFLYRLKKAIKEADAITLKTGRKCLVVNYHGKPTVKTKIELKRLIHSGFFKCDIQAIENKALYKTY